MTWVNGRQLSGVFVDSPGGPVNASYSYDADGIRTQKVVDGEVHSYITQNGKVVRETIGTGSAAKVLDFIYDNNGSPFSLIYNDGTGALRTYYYVLNLQGDVIKLVRPTLNTSGTVTGYTTAATYHYNAWGKIISVISSEKEIIDEKQRIAHINPLRYRGYYYDTETGFYYLQSRYYDPVNCRFMNADSYASTGQGFLGYNMFVYCNNCPVIYSDHTGHISKYSSVALFDSGEEKSSYYVYGYEYSGYAPVGMGTSGVFPVSGSGKIYIFEGISTDDLLNPQTQPDGFNPDTDFMALYYEEMTLNEQTNYIILVADSYNCKSEAQMRAIAKALLSYNAQYKGLWKRTEDSIVREWIEHNRYARWSVTARHTDFDTAEEGKGFGYYMWKAIKRFLF